MAMKMADAIGITPVGLSEIIADLTLSAHAMRRDIKFCLNNSSVNGL